MKTIIILFLFPMVAISILQPLGKANDVGFVFVCLSKTARKYHKYENCRGLLKCTHEVKKLSMSDVDTLRFSACKLCY